MRDAPDRAALARLIADGADVGAVPDALALARGVLAREDAAGTAPVEAWAARLAALYGAADAAAALERRLADEVRAGGCDGGPRRAAARAHLVATVRAKLAELDPALIETWSVLGPLLTEGDAP